MGCRRRALAAGDDAKSSIAGKVPAEQVWTEEEDPEQPGTYGYQREVAPARTTAMRPAEVRGGLAGF